MDSFFLMSARLLVESSPSMKLHERLDFMVFTGLGPSGGQLPDARTSYRFRNRLVKAELDQKLLALINWQKNQIGSSSDIY